MIIAILVTCMLCFDAVISNGTPEGTFLHSVEETRIKSRPGRHVCTAQKTVSTPVAVIQTYRKPVYTPKVRECPNITKNCPQFDVTYIEANRTVYQLQKSSTFQHSCCPGWTKRQLREKGCMKPICNNECGEFGVCEQPNTCKCKSGFSGPMCDTDIDECKTDKHGCHHVCKNTAGGFMCACQEGFILAPDGKTCTFCFTCQKEYRDLVAVLAGFENQVTNENNVQTEIQQLHAKIKDLKEDVSNMTTNNKDVQELHSMITKLKDDVSNLTNENAHLKDAIGALELNHESAMQEIEALQNLTWISEISQTKPPPTTTTARKTTTPIPTTSTTEGSFQINYDPYDLIISLSNQIGLMEEKLDYCQCSENRRRP